MLHDGDMVPPSSVSSWPMQASYAEKGDWQGLNKYNQKQAASRSTAPKAAKAAAATAVAAAATEPDDLTRLSGIGPRMEVLLNEGSVMTYDQLAHQKPEDLRLIVARRGALPPASVHLAGSGCVRGQGRLARARATTRATEPFPRSHPGRGTTFPVDRPALSRSSTVPYHSAAALQSGTPRGGGMLAVQMATDSLPSTSDPRGAARSAAPARRTPAPAGARVAKTPRWTPAPILVRHVRNGIVESRASGRRRRGRRERDGCFRVLGDPDRIVTLRSDRQAVRRGGAARSRRRRGVRPHPGRHRPPERARIPARTSTSGRCRPCSGAPASRRGSSPAAPRACPWTS